MTLRKYIASLILVASALPLVALADDNGIVYTQISTTGLGLGYGKSMDKDWAVRGQFNYFKQSYSGNVSNFGPNAVLEAKVDWSSLQVLADWYPSERGFRLTGGLVLNNNKITIAGNGAVNGVQATVNGEIKMSDGISPYLGLGYSTRPKDAKGFGVNFDLGVMFQEPKVSLTATGNGVTQADIDAQKALMQDAVKDLKNYPVVGLGISYAF